MKIKSILVGLMVVMTTLAFNSCSKDKSADAGELLATIPSDASLVAVANTSAILEKAGCKIEDEKITPSKELMEMVENIKNSETKTAVKTLFSGDSGIDPAVTALFQVGYYKYLTGFLADPSKFKSFVEKNVSTSFNSENDVEVASNVAVKGNRYWINLGQTAIDVMEVKHFASLDKAQSFLSNKYSERMTTIEKDIEGWGNLMGILKTANLSFQDQATIQVAIQTIFEDPASIGFAIEVKDNKLAAEAYPLNSKGNYAKYRLPDEKVDIKTIESIVGNAQGLLAIAIPKKLIEKLSDDASSKSPSVLGIYLKQLSGLDGTAAVAISGEGMRGVLTTNGQEISGLQQILGSDVAITKEGNLLRLSRGTMNGGVEVAKLAEYMKGAIAGVSTAIEPGKPFTSGGVASVTLRKSGDGLQIRVDAVSNDKKENMLVTLLKQ